MEKCKWYNFNNLNVCLRVYVFYKQKKNTDFLKLPSCQQCLLSGREKLG